MQLITILATASAALIPAASAWRFQLWSDTALTKKIFDAGGESAQTCWTLSSTSNNKSRGIAWVGGSDGGRLLCTVYVYDDNSCRTNIGAFEGNVQRAITAANQLKISSYRVSCR